MKLICQNQSGAQKLLNFFLLTAFLSMILAYIIGVMNGNHEAWLPFISELDESSPEGTLWTFGLTIAGVASIPIWMKLYGKWDRELRSSNAGEKWLRFNLLIFVMAQIATVSLIWCVNLPFNKYPIPHVATAAVYFWLVLGLGTIAIFVVRKIDNYPKDLIRVRLALNLTGYASMILMGVFIPQEITQGMQLDPNHAHNIHSISALFEWLMVFTAQLGYFYTFNYDMESESTT